MARSFVRGTSLCPRLEPGGRGALRLPEGLLDGIGATGEVWLTLSFVTVASTPWCEAGHEVGWTQVPVRGPSEVEAQAASGDAAGVDIDADGRSTHPLLAAAPTLALWRAPTQNDRIGGMAASWERLGLDDMARRLLGVERTAQGTIVKSQHRTMSGAVVDDQQVITTLADGSLRIEETAVVPEDLDDLPRVGTVLEAAPGLPVRWFGAGPHRDVSGSPEGAHRSAAVALADADRALISVAQENGGHADVRWLELTDATGHGPADHDGPTPAGVGIPIRARTWPRRRITMSSSRARMQWSTWTPRIAVWVRPAAARHVAGPSAAPGYLSAGAGRSRRWTRWSEAGADTSRPGHAS